MKARVVQIHLLPGHARNAGNARLANADDLTITTQEQADAYTGPVFMEGEGTADLHVVYRDGFVCVNFEDESGARVNYDFPQHTIARIKRLA